MPDKIDTLLGLLVKQWGIVLPACQKCNRIESIIVNQIGADQYIKAISIKGVCSNCATENYFRYSLVDIARIFEGKA